MSETFSNPARPAGSRRPDATTRPLTLLVAGTVIVFLLALLGVEMTRVGGNVANIWMPNAAALGLILRLPVRWAPAALLSSFLAITAANLFFGDALAVSLSLGAANLAGISTAWLLLRMLGFQRQDILTIGGAVIFLFAAGIAGPVCGAVIGSAVINHFYSVPFEMVFGTWLMSDIVGVIVAGPAALAHWRKGLKPRDAVPELLAGVAVACILPLLVSGLGYPYIIDLAPLLLLIPAIRTGLVGVGIVSSAFAIATTWVVISATGDSAVPLSGSLAETQAFILAIATLSNLIAVFWQRQRDDREKLRIQARAIESASDGVLLVDRHGRFTSWNAAVAKFFPGIGSDAQLGGQERYREQNLAFLQRLASGERISNEYLDRMNQQGDKVQIRVNADPLIENGEFAGAVIIIRDVGEVEQLRQEADRRAAEIEALIEASSDAVVGTDMRGRINIWNRAAESFLGLSAKEAIGMNVVDVKGISTLEDHMERFRRLLDGEFIRSQIAVTNSRTGESREIELAVNPIVRADGKMTGSACLLRDITPLLDSRTRTETAEHLLAQAISAIPDSIAIYDGDERLAICNQAYSHLVANQEPAEMVGRKWEDVLRGNLNAGWVKTPDGDFDSWVAKRRQRRRENAPYVVELEGDRWQVVKDYEIPGGGFITVRQDVTDLKRAEVDLQRSKAELEALINATSYAVIGTDADGIIKFWNRSAEEFYGRTAEQIVGTSFVDLPGGPSRDERQERVGLLREGGSERKELTLTNDQTGEVRHVELAANAIFNPDGEFEGTAALLRDVTPLLESRSERDAAERMLIQAMTAMSGSIAIFDADERLVLCNRAYANTLAGGDVDNLVGRQWEDILRESVESGAIVLGDVDVDAWIRQRREHRVSGGDIFINEVAGDQWRMGQDHPAPDGGFITIRQDITELKRAQAELQRSNDELEEFAFVASHDLQEPLRKVLSFGSILETEFREDLPEEAREYLDFMTRGARRMQDLIQDLLAYSRVSSHAVGLEIADLTELAEMARENLSEAISGSGARVEIGELGSAQVRPGDMVRCFQNLIGNAIKYRDPERTPDIRVSARPGAKGNIEILCEDNGLGIEPEYVEQVFQPFKRLHSHTSIEGTGMGLSITRKVVRSLGGEISLSSSPGTGSTFMISLPGVSG